MNGKEKNIFIASAFSLIIGFILTAFFIGSSSNNTLILQPGTDKVINQTQESVDSIIESNNSTILGAEENNAVRLIDTPFETQKKSNITLYGFIENDIITTPLILAGKVPSNWVSEGIIGVNVLSETGSIIQKGYAEADILDSYGEVISGDVEFTVNMKIEKFSETSLTKGKLQFTSANPSLEDSLEIPVLFE